MKKVLVDADALVALAKEDDFNHAKALKIAKRLEEDSLYITPLTIPEAATVISYHVSHQAAKNFFTEAQKRKLIELPLTFEIRRRADEIFLGQKRKGTFWIDCLNVAMVQAHSLIGIFSFDKFYRRMEIRLVE